MVKKEKKKKMGEIPYNYKSSKVAIQIKDETRTCTKFRKNIQLKGIQKSLIK